MGSQLKFKILECHFTFLYQTKHMCCDFYFSLERIMSIRWKKIHGVLFASFHFLFACSMFITDANYLSIHLLDSSQFRTDSDKAFWMLYEFMGCQYGDFLVVLPMSCVLYAANKKLKHLAYFEILSG